MVMKAPPKRALTTPLDLPATAAMEKEIITVSRTAPLSKVERLLTEHRVSGLPVTDVSGRAIGVISYRDLLDHYAEEDGTRPSRRPDYYRVSAEELRDEDVDVGFEVPEESEGTAEQAMTGDVIHVRSDAPLREVARTMAKRSIHRVLVTDPRTNRVVGIISSLGLLSALGR